MTTKSEALFEKSKTLFPGGVNSPVRAFRSVGGTPIFMKKGKGPLLWDADGNEYIDYCCSWGPLILGHAPESVLNKVRTTMENGTSFGAPTELENELAELIIKNHNAIEKIRFVSSGTEAVMSAIRLARGITGKSKILKFEGCYHGHADGLLVKAGSGLVTLGNTTSAGIPPAIANETLVALLDSEESVKQAFAEHEKDIACVIIEPVPANNGLLLQRPEFLKFLREICTQHQSLLIFDEVISGFRLGFSGASGFYGIKPDLLTFGKIIGGGFPVGAFAGSAAAMDNVSPQGNVYQAGTLSGNPVAMAAGIAQLSECLKPGFYARLETLTSQLCDGLENVILKNIGKKEKVIRLGSIFWLSFSESNNIRKASDIAEEGIESFRKIYHPLLKKGIYLGPSGYEVGFVSAAHNSTHIKKTILAFEEVLASSLS